MSERFALSLVSVDTHIIIVTVVIVVIGTALYSGEQNRRDHFPQWGTTLLSTVASAGEVQSMWLVCWSLMIGC